MRVMDTKVAVGPQTVAPECELTLSELAEIIGGLKKLPTLDEVKDWFSRVLLRQRDYEQYRIFTPRKYARNLVIRSEHAELLMLCWRPGQRTPIHDHGGSIGVILVCEGLLTETMFERMPEGHVRPYNTTRWAPGAITGADVPDIHQLLNLQPTGRDMVTLHCYAPPLTFLNKYSPRSAKIARWREGYFAGGAGI